MGDSALEKFLVDVRPDAESIVVAIDSAIREAADLDSAIKWHQLTYAVGGDFHHWICAMKVTKKVVVLNFHFGSLLADPEGAFRQGTSAFMRMLDFASPSEVDAGLIGRRVVEAVSRLDYFKENWRKIQAGDADVSTDGGARE